MTERPRPSSTPLAPDSRKRVDTTFLLEVSGATDVLLVRHAQQQLSPGEFLTSDTGDLHDPPLSELGRRQAAAAAEALISEKVDGVYTSTSRRALDTGTMIAAASAAPLEAIDDLREFGFFRDLPADQTPEEALGLDRLRGFLRTWSRTRSLAAWPASEPVTEFRHRVVTAIEGLIARHRGGRLAVVTHGAVINVFLGEFLGVTDDMFFIPAHTSITRVRAKHDRRVLVSLNETHHLMGDPDALTY